MGLFDMFTKKNSKPAYAPPAYVPAGAPAADLYAYRGSAADYFDALLTGCFGEYEIQRNVTTLAGKTAPAAATSAGKGWTCSCGTENLGSFCFNCGEKRPVVQASSGSWKCACGSENTGKFCPECGAAKPVSNEWTCSCGAVNKGKFCPECGSRKPEAVASAPAAVGAYRPSITLAYADDTPVDFLLLKDGQPKLAIILVSKVKYKCKAVRSTMTNCDTHGIPCLRFFPEFRNQADYVISRIRREIRH